MKRLLNIFSLTCTKINQYQYPKLIMLKECRNEINFYNITFDFNYYTYKMYSKLILIFINRQSNFVEDYNLCKNCKNNQNKELIIIASRHLFYIQFITDYS